MTVQLAQLAPLAYAGQGAVTFIVTARLMITAHLQGACRMRGRDLVELIGWPVIWPVFWVVPFWPERWR